MSLATASVMLGLNLVLLTEGIAASCEDQQRIVNAMPAASRRRIYARVVAGYDKGAAIGRWPDVGEVLENYERLTAGKG